MSYVATHGWGRIYLEEVATIHVTASQPRGLYHCQWVNTTPQGYCKRFRGSSEDAINKRNVQDQQNVQVQQNVQDQRNVQDHQPQLLIREHMPRNWHSIMDDDGMETVRFHGKPRISTCHHGQADHRGEDHHVPVAHLGQGQPCDCSAPHQTRSCIGGSSKL